MESRSSRSSSLSFAFEARLPPWAAPADRAPLQALLRGAWAQARRRYPEVGVSAQLFGGWIAERVDPDRPLESLQGLSVADLLLCCGMRHGDPGALRAFDRLCREVEATLRRHGGLEPWVPEVVEWLQAHMLVPRLDDDEPEGAPRSGLDRYAGHGPLLGWMKVLAVREALGRLKRAPAAPAPAPTAPAAPRPEPDLAARAPSTVGGSSPPAAARPRPSRTPAEQLRRNYRAALHRSFATALSALDEDDRRLVSRHHLQGWSLEQLAAHLGTSPATTARRLARARGRLIRLTRDELGHCVDAPRAELDKLVEGLRQGLMGGLQRVLAG